MRRFEDEHVVDSCDRAKVDVNPPSPQMQQEKPERYQSGIRQVRMSKTRSGEGEHDRARRFTGSNTPNSSEYRERSYEVIGVTEVRSNVWKQRKTQPDHQKRDANICT